MRCDGSGATGLCPTLRIVRSCCASPKAPRRSSRRGGIDCSRWTGTRGYGLAVGPGDFDGPRRNDGTPQKDRGVTRRRQGGAFKIQYEAETRIAHVTRTGEDKFLFTARDVSGKTIFTHHDNVNTQYFANIGITLPKGF
jgi:hypothetical protein